MTPEQNISLARQYVEHSNAHNLNAIRDMLSPKTRYTSSRVGEHHGLEAIISMMDGFFAGFPDVNWQVPEYKTETGNAVIFNFIMTATAKDSGDQINRNGVERIEFDASGLIIWIDVQA